MINVFKLFVVLLPLQIFSVNALAHDDHDHSDQAEKFEFRKEVKTDNELYKLIVLSKEDPMIVGENQFTLRIKEDPSGGHGHGISAKMTVTNLDSGDVLDVIEYVDVNGHGKLRADFEIPQSAKWEFKIKCKNFDLIGHLPCFGELSAHV